MKKESKYEITAKGINTINFYSFNFTYIDQEEAVLYCCLLQESERYGYGWFFWKDKELMQYGRKTYERLRDRLCDKRLIEVQNAGFNNKQHYLINYKEAINQIETLFKDHQEEMKLYLEKEYEKQKVRVQSQEKLNARSEKKEVKAEVEMEIKPNNEKTDTDSIQEKSNFQQQTATTQPIQLNKEKTYVEKWIEHYPFLKTKKNLTDQYLMTAKQQEKLKYELNKVPVVDAEIDALLQRIVEYRVGKAEGGKMIEGLIADNEKRKEIKQQETNNTNIQAGKTKSIPVVHRSSIEEVKKELPLIPVDLIEEIVKDVPAILNQYSEPILRFDFSQLHDYNLPRLNLNDGQVNQFLEFLQKNNFNEDILIGVMRKTRRMYDKLQLNVQK